MHITFDILYRGYYWLLGVLHGYIYGVHWFMVWTWRYGVSRNIDMGQSVIS